MKRTYSAFALLNAAGRMVDIAMTEDRLRKSPFDTVLRCRAVLDVERLRRPVSRKEPVLVPTRIRAHVLARDKGKCRWCGVGFRQPLELHHVRKRSQGRDDKPENLLTLCAKCHSLTDAPYSRGRLVVTPIPGGDFHLELVTKPDKFAPDPVAS